MEIERKFLLSALPNGIEGYENSEIAQAYISVDPVIRLRRRGGQFYLTMKQTGLLAREESEFVITQAQFDRLWGKIETRAIQKTRYLIPLPNGLTAEADIYHGDLQGLLTVEVEFDSVEQANAFDPPEWFGMEVTNDPKYANSSLAINEICF